MKMPHGIRIGVRTVLLSAMSPLMEKNPLKARGGRAPVMLSMSRAIVLMFAVALCRQFWAGGVAGWPEATLAVAVVLALPVLNALDQSTPTEVLTLAKDLIRRFGIGDVRTIGSLFVEPSKFDDHTNDGGPSQ